MKIESLYFSEGEVMELTGLKQGRLRYWARLGFFPPRYEIDRRRVYDFRDVVGLRACAVLRDRGVSRQELAKVDPWLHEQHETPWASLTLYVSGKKIYFRNPETGEIESARHKRQGAFEFAMEKVADSVREEIKRRRNRKKSDFGKASQSRRVVGNERVISGTRIPTRAIFNFHADGYDVDHILNQYPSLTREDVDFAIRLEEGRAA